MKLHKLQLLQRILPQNLKLPKHFTSRDLQSRPLNYGFPIQEQNTFKTLKISTNLNIQNKKIELI
jgi:hypothetical protein